MKKIITIILLFVVSASSAQIVNIPDPDFKNELVNYSPVIDINHDGEIQVSEAIAITNLSIYATDITGIQAFENLDSLDSHGNTPNIDLSNMTHLRKLFVSAASSSFNVSGCNNLEFLSFGFGLNNYVGDVTINLPRLKIIDCQSRNVGNMILTGCDSLRKITLNGGLQAINKLDISGLNQIDSITDIYAINRLIARNCTGLKVIQSSMFGGDIIDELDVTGCINLKKILLLETYFPTLDLSTCTSLKILMITGEAAYLQNLNIKNGLQLDSIYLHNNTTPTTPLNVCADDFEIDSVSHMIARYYNFVFPRPFFVNSYCSFFPGGAYNTIKGKATRDINNNGCDPTDVGMPNVPIKFTDTSGQSIVRYTATNGLYDVFTYKGIFTVLPYFPYPYYNITPANATVTFDTANSLIDSVHFCIKPTGVYNDLEISFLPTSPRARPGLLAGYQLVYKNRGTTTLSGNVQLNFNDNRMSFSNASVPLNNQSPGQIVWNYSNLQPFENRTIDVQFLLLPPPVNNVGDTIYYQATVNPVAGDQTPADNSFTLPQLVRGSFDPNDKECLEGSKIAITSIDNYLHYIIHFQNVGNDTAFNVVVVDTLSSKLDWNSFDFIGSSHPCQVTQKGDKLEFYFENIKLPYKAINELASNGFVAFMIKPKNTVVVGDSLKNKAAIYFDFNLPVITNTTSTVIAVAAPIPVKLEYFYGSSNAANNLLSWKAPSTYGSTNFNIERSSDGINFSSIGSMTASFERCQLPFSFTDQNRLAGKNFYRLKITDADGKFFYSKIVVLNNNGQSIDITAVTNEQNSIAVYLSSAKMQTVQIKLVSADGRLIYSLSKAITAGNCRVDLSVKNMAGGVYMLVVYTNEGEVISKRFIK